MSGLGAEYWGSSQACLSLAIWGAGYAARVLPPTHNIPIHQPDYLEFGPTPEPAIAVHYHHLFGGDQADNPMFQGGVNAPAQLLSWLRSELPIHD